MPRPEARTPTSRPYAHTCVDVYIYIYMIKMAGQNGRTMLVGITDCAHRLFLRTAIGKRCVRAESPEQTWAR